MLGRKGRILRRLAGYIFAGVLWCVSSVAASVACTSNEIDVLGDGTQCEAAKFTVTTTNLSANTEFRFTITAEGTFYVDWGDGTVERLSHISTLEVLHKHKYTTAGVKTIRFGGVATEYSITGTASAIQFGNSLSGSIYPTRDLVAALDGDLSAIFPALQSNTNIDDTPRFYRAFYNCSNLKTIPATLFSGYTTGARQMFDSTFYGCSSLESIPDTLFANITTGAREMFDSTFYGCSNATGYISYSLFAGLIANGSPYETDMMKNIFNGDNNLAYQCPCTTKQYITGYESYWDSHIACGPATEYTITYDMDGGTNYSGAPVSYFSDDGCDTEINGTPTKANTRFIEWCTDSGLENCASTQTISSGTTGNKTFYAKWLECTGWTYYDSELEACATCENQGFTITTTNLEANTEFWVSMSPKGSFTIDWGDGEIEHISRDDTNATAYTHTYETGGVKNIKFCGKANEYNSSVGDNVVAAISFYNGTTNGSQTKIASVSGALGDVFPTIGNGANPNQQPRFRSTFQSASNLKSVPATLFNGISGSADGMFRSTFDRCSSLTSVPDGLFANATGGAPNMFRSTFYNCTGLKAIPPGLFAGITKAVNNEFMYTFYGTTGLSGTYIPPTTFSGLINAGSPQPTSGVMWNQTFEGSGLLTSCPERTHQYITGYEGNVASGSWNTRVSCEPNNPCVGTEYWDSTNEACVPCPNGYTYDTTDTKESINQCAIRCSAGQYLANANDAACTNAGVGYYAAGDIVNYGSTSSRIQCPNGMPTLNNKTNASNESQCVVYCTGTNYRDSLTNTCVACPTGYDYDPSNGKTSDTDCKIHCESGTFLPIERANSCINVGDGFYAPEATIAYGGIAPRTQCPDGRMTGTLNASSSSQCIELCTGATYHDSLTNRCVPCPMGYNAHTISGKTSANQCQIHCVAGTYIANVHDTSCTNVGDGYYAPASSVNYGEVGNNRMPCPNGQLTGIQTATDLSQCKTSCQGATYYNSTTNQCENCPTGYTDNITNGKNSINQCQHYCPAGAYAETYTPVLYLSSTGSKQFIDTGYEITGTHVNGTAVVATNTTISGSGSDSGNFFGNIYGPGGFSSNYKKGMFGLWIQAPKTGNKATYTTTFTAGQQYTITYDVSIGSKSGTATLNVNGVSADPYTHTGAVINGSGNSFKLFTNGGATRDGNKVIVNNWGDKLFSGRIYSLQMYEGGILVLDLIPVRRESDGALGMFNRITNEFYGNAGLDNFTAGEDNGDSFMLCTPAGNGYYVAENYTNFGSFGTRNRCPNGAPTMENGDIINNAYSIYQCDGVEPCNGAMYPDSNTGTCTSCPAGYDFNTQNRKESIYECQTHCYDGTYLANMYDITCTNAGNGYYATEDTINWGDVGMRTRCPNGGPTNKEDAADESECMEVTACTGATYMNLGVCVPCPPGYEGNVTEGKNAAGDCQLFCPEGTYMDTINGTTCTDAGVGFWATGGAVNYGSTSSRTACAAGLTTVGYGHGADELADCGRKLHIGDYILYSKTAKPTTPALNIQPDNSRVYYVGVSDTNHTLTPVHITHGELQYTAFDDSILYGERDFITNTRITQ